MLDDKYVTMEIEKVKHIALVAHDGKKRELVDWCEKNKEILKGHFLCGTGTTARLIAERTGLPVKGYCSGPYTIFLLQIILRLRTLCFIQNI